VKDRTFGAAGILKEKDLIHPKYKFLNNGSLYPVDHLTPNNISEGFSIYEKISNFNQSEK
jgi:hypothetical protein